jgi:hypothetical protein
MIGIIAKLFVVAAALTPLLLSSPAAAAPAQVAYVSSTGSDNDNTCTTVAQPCATVGQAVVEISGTSGGVVSCINGTGPINDTGGSELPYSFELTIDCPGGTFLGDGVNQFDLLLTGANQTLKIRHLTFDLANTASGASAILFQGSGNLILEDCVFENGSGVALNITPNGPLTLVIKNSRISNNTAAGVLIKPASGGSVTATFDGVTITNNAGGLHTDTTNGAVRVDISNSTISNNADNGLAIIGGAGGANMVTVKNGVIASNGQAGIEASGFNAAVLVNNAVLDSNTGGAISAVSSGRVLTYQNNTVIGNVGTGFTGTAAPQ